VKITQTFKSKARAMAPWLVLVVVGVILFLIGIDPDLIGMNRSPAVGFVQIGVWLIGLAVALLGGYVAVRRLRGGRPKSLRADIGVRMAATGYVVAAVASLADFIGIGSHHQPGIVFGKLQKFGLGLGIALILLGLVLYLPLGRRKPADEDAPEKAN
jgi:hypothetical protein